MLAVTILTHNDNHLLFYTLKQLFNNTNFNQDSTGNVSATGNVPVTTFFVLLQSCSKAFVKATEYLFKSNDTIDSSNRKFKYNIINEESNLGVSKANNKLADFTKDYKYVFHLEDDWILYKSDREWLNNCIYYLETNNDISTIALRKYGNDQEKYQYGWTRTIPYTCHQFKDNFNYQTKLKNEIDIFSTTFPFKMTEIEHYLFTFNPTIRRNKDYYNCGVYPLPEFNYKDTNEDLSIKGVHTGDSWGYCEALTMEKTRELKTVMMNEGCFIHFDDWINVLRQEDSVIFSNNYEGIYNINCHLPILIVHLDDTQTRIINIKHDYIFPLNFYWFNNNEHRITEFRKILSKYQPKAIITVGNTTNYIQYYSKFVSFEYRKRWLHYGSLSDININQIENCIFRAMFKHPYQVDNPIISVVTPAYESKHRIFRPYYSLLNQTYTNWEWIIIDDSKTDDTWKTLTEFAEQDHRIQVYKRPSNDGSIGKNKLFCGNLARGKYIFELDHDDTILNNTFELIINAGIKYPDAGFFYSNFVECYENTLQTFNYGDHFGLGFGSYYKSWYENDFHYICQTPRINPQTLRHIVGVPNHFRCWTRESYHATLGHSQDLPVVDDYDLIIRTMLKYKWCHIPELCYVQYRNYGGDNFTFHRNSMIQYLVQKLRILYEEDIHSRLLELNVNDDVYYKTAGHSKDWENNVFEYPILEYVYKEKDTKENPLISIVVPTYNRPEHLRKALDSIFNQDYQNFEIYVIGDCCPKLEEFIKTYERAKDSRFRYYNLVKQGGPGGHLPRNYALKMLINTEWVAYLDDDNEWSVNHLSHIVEEIRKDESLEFIFSSMIINEKELLFDFPRKGRIDTSCVVHKWKLCYTRGLWKDRIEGGYAHDFEFFNRITSNFSCVWKATKKFTLLYNTEFNGQSYNQLIQM